MNKTLFRIIVGSAALVVCIVLIVFLTVYHVDDVEIVGNTRNSEEEVKDVVLSGPFASNSFLLSVFRKTVVTDELPFVDDVKIEQVSPGKIRLHVNEKQIVGYVRYLDCNMYFDKDGIVVESEVAPDAGKNTQSEVVEPQQVVVDPVEVEDENETNYHAAVTDVPRITGLTFDQVVLEEKLPVKDDSVFNTILGIARIVEKYNIMPDQVEFDEKYEITLYYGTIRVTLGVDNLLEEKITRVAAILPKLTGKSGVLHMEDYTRDTVNIIFTEDVPEEEQTDSMEEDTDEENPEEENPDEDVSEEEVSEEEISLEETTQEESSEEESDSEESAGEESTGDDDSQEEFSETEDEETVTEEDSEEDAYEEEDTSLEEESSE